MSETPQLASRRRLVAARALTVLAIVLTVVSVLANYVKREALDESSFRETSRRLIADPDVQDQLAVTIVDQLYANVDVSRSLREQLPPNLQGLSGPIAGAVREAADRSARGLLQRPRVQDSFVDVSTAAQRELVAVLDGDTTALETTGGKVVLDVRPLVLALGDRFSIANLESKVPEGAARVTILESDQLKIAQDATNALRFVANWIWVLALAAAAGAIWLARGRRRRELRANATGLLIVGVLLLVIQALVGRYLVGHLVTAESVRPAVAASYAILTNLLRGDGWTAILIATVALLGIWLSGPRPRAVGTRRALSPYLRRPEIAYGAFVVCYLLLLWWKPTPQFGFASTVVFWFLIALIGFEALRRQTVREFPDTEPKGLLETFRAAAGRARPRRGAESASAELERLARLHREGSLDDAEFATAKAQLIGSPLGSATA